MAIVFMVAGFSFARDYETGYEPVGLDALKKQKGVFKTTLIHPEVDFSRFAGFQQQTVGLFVQDPGAGGGYSTGRLTSRERELVIPEYDEVVEFKRIIGEALAEELVRMTHLEPVDQAGPGTLILQATVTDAKFSVSSTKRDENGDQHTELDEGVILIDFIDAETGKIVARFADRRKCKAPKGVKPEPGAWPNLARWAHEAASDLGQELNRVQAGSRRG
jgi:hypothetical protein